MQLNKSIFSADRLYWILLIFILLWGGVLRFHALDFQSLWIDESFSALASEKIAVSGSPLLDSGRYYGRSKPHTYLGAILITLFGKNAFALRLPSAVFGTAMILLAAVSCRIFYGQWLPGLVAALLVCFNYYEIAWSRQIRMYMEFQFFFSLTLLLLYICIVKGKNTLLFLGTLLLCYSMTLMLHKSGILVIVPATIMATFYRKNLTKKKATTIGLLITASIIFYFIQYGMGSNGVRQEPIQFFSYIARLPVQFIHYSNFLLQNHSFAITGSLLSILFIFKNRTKEDIIFITSFLTILILASSQNGILMRSLFFAYPLLFYVAAHGLTQAGEFATVLIKKTKIINKQVNSSAIILALTFFGIAGTAFTNEQHIVLPKKIYFLEYDPTYSELNTWDYTPQPDFNSAYAYIKKHMSEKDIFIVAHTAIHHWYMPGSETYWLGFLFLEDPKRTSFINKKPDGIKDEGYMGYPVINSKEDMQRIFANHHGFVIIDYYSMSTKPPPGFVKYLLEQAPVIYHDDAHPDRPWTRVWVGRF